MLVRRAFNDAGAAPAGPVFLSLPMDVMEEMSTVGLVDRSVINRDAVAGGLPELARILSSIVPGRLALIAGDEVYASDASAVAMAVAESLGAKVYGSSWPSRIPVPTSHSLWAGNLPTKASALSDLLSNYDAIFALGGKSLITILYTEGSAVPNGCDVYQLSSDVRDLGRTYATKLSAVGDLKASLTELLPLLREMTSERTSTYRKQVDDAGRARAAKRVELFKLAEDQWDMLPMTPLVAAREAVRAIGPKIPIVDEAIATSSHVRAFLDSDLSSQYSFMRGGGLGWGMPASVGCSLGLGRAPVVCLIGDGAAMYSPQSLWTAAHEELPITFVVMNNREYNVLKNFMRSQTNYVSNRLNHFLAMDLENPRIDYVALAASMGVPATRVQRAADVAPAIEAGIASRKANLIEVLISAT
ncbi:benzoylformate decarboxylase [Rhizobium aquaticum]|uniref:Benzoylformate decarboxylase n=1 Tax=Rhizobium aquaticum TaxID=1549636 RepID=A0ABV2J6H9_9HYPH